MNAKLSDPKRIMGYQRPPRRRRGPNGEELEEEEEDEGMIDLRMLVHQSVAGSIIGRGGERIRELRSKHKMRVIKVYQMLAPLSTDRVVQLVAEPENAINCLESVVEVVENTPIRGAVENYDSANSSEVDALTYGGWLTPEGHQALTQGMPLGGGMPMPGPEMGGPRGMPPMGREAMYPRGPRGMPPPVAPQNMYGGGRMGGPPPMGPSPSRRSGYDQAPYAAPGGYDGVPQSGMSGPGNQSYGYDESQGYYQSPIGPNGTGMVLQSTGGYGGPVSRPPPPPPQVPSGPGPMGMPYKGAAPPPMYGAPVANYHSAPPEDGKTSQWGW
uniref:Heterogeneous nuclear ribonucleoprotein K n=1 Tax=Schistocephalus solidus TaxID=70667 RepID=A0A0X3P968_SCHSO